MLNPDLHSLHDLLLIYPLVATLIAIPLLLKRKSIALILLLTSAVVHAYPIIAILLLKNGLYPEEFLPTILPRLMDTVLVEELAYNTIILPFFESLSLVVCLCGARVFQKIWPRSFALFLALFWAALLLAYVAHFWGFGEIFPHNIFAD